MRVGGSDRFYNNNNNNNNNNSGDSSSSSGGGSCNSSSATTSSRIHTCWLRGELVDDVLLGATTLLLTEAMRVGGVTIADSKRVLRSLLSISSARISLRNIKYSSTSTRMI